MPTLPAELLPLIVNFQPLFSKSVWENAQTLLVGAILAIGNRTVTACLRVTGKTFAPSGELIIGIDDTIERRRGAKIKAKGIYRDPVRSSQSHFVKASGLRWLCSMLLVEIPWAGCEI